MFDVYRGFAVCFIMTIFINSAMEFMDVMNEWMLTICYIKNCYFSFAMVFTYFYLLNFYCYIIVIWYIDNVYMNGIFCYTCTSFFSFYEEKEEEYYWIIIFFNCELLWRYLVKICIGYFWQRKHKNIGRNFNFFYLVFRFCIIIKGGDCWPNGLIL